MKKLWWRISHFSRNYKTNNDLTKLIYKCIWIIENCPDAKIEVTNYHIYISTSTSKIDLWNENKFYGWLSQGYADNVRFDNTMPSRSAAYDFKECLKKHGYNIHCDGQNQKIPSDHIKC